MGVGCPSQSSLSATLEACLEVELSFNPLLAVCFNMIFIKLLNMPGRGLRLCKITSS